MKIVLKDTNSDISAQIASTLRDANISGYLRVDQRLPSKAELAKEFNVSRPTVHVALKRLAAQCIWRDIH